MLVILSLCNAEDSAWAGEKGDRGFIVAIGRGGSLGLHGAQCGAEILQENLRKRKTLSPEKA